MLVEKATSMLMEKATSMLVEKATSMLVEKATSMLMEKATRMLMEKTTSMLMVESLVPGLESLGPWLLGYPTSMPMQGHKGGVCQSAKYKKYLNS